MVAFMHTGTRLTAGYRYTTLGDATLGPIDLKRILGLVEGKFWIDLSGCWGLG